MIWYRSASLPKVLSFFARTSQTTTRNYANPFTMDALLDRCVPLGGLMAPVIHVRIGEQIHVQRCRANGGRVARSTLVLVLYKRSCHARRWFAGTSLCLQNGYLLSSSCFGFWLATIPAVAKVVIVTYPRLVEAVFDAHRAPRLRVRIAAIEDVVKKCRSHLALLTLVGGVRVTVLQVGVCESIYV
jgi:hypothetical protein